MKTTDFKPQYDGYRFQARQLGSEIQVYAHAVEYICTCTRPLIADMVVDALNGAEQLERLRAENAALRELVTDIRDNWDCDADGHRYGTGCRACKAAELLKERQVQSDH